MQAIVPVNSSICRVNRIRKFNGWLDRVSVSILTVRAARLRSPCGDVELSGKSEFVTRNIDHVINLQTIMEYGRFMEYGSDENLCHRYALQCNEKIMEIMDMHNSTR